MYVRRTNANQKKRKMAKVEWNTGIDSVSGTPKQWLMVERLMANGRKAKVGKIAREGDFSIFIENYLRMSKIIRTFAAF